jgi:hypothetical protein
LTLVVQTKTSRGDLRGPGDVQRRRQAIIFRLGGVVFFGIESARGGLPSSIRACAQNEIC